MNVYVREVASALAQAGVECTTYTRADRPGPARRGRWSSPATASCTSRPGRSTCPRRRWPTCSTRSPPACATHLRSGPGVDVVHGNYWLSGVVGHRLKHELDVPLVSTFHTLARVKAEGGDLEPAWRDRAEAEIIGCSDAICVSCPEEERQFRRLYGDPAGRIEIVPPAVEHAFFAPGDRPAPAGPSGCPATGRWCCSSGGSSRSRGRTSRSGRSPSCARATPCSSSSAARAASDGDAEAALARQLVDELGVGDRVRFVDPQPHHILSSYYRAADVVIVPSRSESFGLVALEAAACGIPVVASAVGGLLNIVHDGVTGLLVEGRDPARFARASPRCSTIPPAPRRWARRPRCGRGGSRGASRRPGCGACTPTSASRRRPSSSPAHERRLWSRVTDVYDAGELAVLERRIDEWLATIAAGAMPVEAIERGEGDERRWYVRMRGEDKDFTTIWLTLGQRTLRYETYVMPAPEENAAALYEHCCAATSASSAPTSRSASRTPCSCAASSARRARRGRARPGDRHAVRDGRADASGPAADRLRQPLRLTGRPCPGRRQRSSDIPEAHRPGHSPWGSRHGRKRQRREALGTGVGPAWPAGPSCATASPGRPQPGRRSDPLRVGRERPEQPLAS